MPTKSFRWIASWKRGIPLLAALALNSCIVYFSTGPTPVSGATIVFVATGGLPALLTPRYTDWVVDWPA